MENGNIYEMKKKGQSFLNSQTKPFLYGGLIVILVLLLSKSIVVIPAGHVGVQDFFGNVKEQSLSAGIHVINPLLRIHKMDVRTREITEMSEVPSEEGLNVKLDVSLLHSLDPQKAAHVYKTVGANYTRVVVIPQLRSIIRGVTASYQAKALYTSAREAIAQEMFDQLTPHLNERGIRVEKVLLRSVTLPNILATAIEKKLEAEQQAEQMKFVLQREKQEAERKKVEAKGISDFQKIVSAGITSSYIRWKGIEATKQLAESENAKIVIVGSGKDGLPVILGGSNF